MGINFFHGIILGAIFRSFLRVFSVLLTIDIYNIQIHTQKAIYIFIFRYQRAYGIYEEGVQP